MKHILSTFIIITLFTACFAKRNMKHAQDVIPPNGEYLFDVAFAEWQGESMGVKVKIVINGDSIKVIYEGYGDLSAEIGEIIAQGKIMKHKSGVWIIGENQSDTQLDEVGGCIGGPNIIDFEDKKFWLC